MCKKAIGQKNELMWIGGLNYLSWNYFPEFQIALQKWTKPKRFLQPDHICHFDKIKISENTQSQW